MNHIQAPLGILIRFKLFAARSSPAIPDTSISGKRVVRELTGLIAARGKPGMIVSDNGTELTSNAVLE